MTLYGMAVFSLVYCLAVASPGPGVAAIVARSLSRGTQGAPAFIAGFLIGDLVWLTVAATGLAALAQSAHAVFVAVKYAGVAYLLYLSYRMWTTAAKPPVADGDEVDPSQKPARLFLTTLSLTMGNPKTMVFFLALLPTVVKLETLTVGGFFEIAAVICVVLPAVLGGYVYAAARARRFLQSPRAIRMVNRGGATAMAGAAVVIAARAN
ncbi:MAG TPA: LysE family translocator [Steroidobacteraceae bacterium]|jgi:threonine/homoserine/homoserine lactone efflux protein|nr:LysE family translocator [Steroidobacteraceae bacterium]